MIIAKGKHMKVLITLGLLVSSMTAWSQDFGDIVREKRKCYERYDTAGKIVPPEQRRYAEWECGKMAGVVDCGEKLTFDEGTGLVYSGNYGKPFTGTCEDCHMTGVIHHRVTFVNGKPHGTDTTYYSSQCIQVIRSHVQGARMGTWRYYFDSTDFLAWEMNYQLDELHGSQMYYKLVKENPKDTETWDTDTLRWEVYQNGILHGTKRTYYPGSRIKSEVDYANGIFHGKHKTYNRDGIVIQEVNYKEGKKNEEAKYHYDDGVLLKTENWDMDVKEGEFKMYYYQGNVQTEEVYRKGIRIGHYAEYYLDGIPKLTIDYDKKGVRVEEHRYDEHGRETYAFGTPTDQGAEDDEMPTADKKNKKKRK